MSVRDLILTPRRPGAVLVLAACFLSPSACAQSGSGVDAVMSMGRLDASTHQVVFTHKPPEDKTPDHAAVWTAIGRKYFKEKKYRLAADQLHQALIAIEQERTGGPFLYAALRNYATALKMDGRTAESAKYMQRALATSKSAELPQSVTSEPGILDVGLNEPTRDVRETVFNAEVMAHHGQSGPIKTYLKVCELDNLKAVLKRAGRLKDAGHNAEALQLYTRAVELASKTEPPDHELALALNGLAGTYAKTGHPGVAETNYQKALALAARLDGKQSVLYATILNNLATAQFEKNDMQGAQSSSKEAARIFEGAKNPDSVQLGQAYYTLSLTQAAQQDVGGALASCEKSVKYYMDVLSEDPRLALALDNLGTLYDQKDNPQKGEQCHRASISIYERLYGDKNADLAIALNNLANTLFQEERDDEAIATLQRAVSVMAKVYGADSAQAKQLSAHLDTVTRERTQVK